MISKKVGLSLLMVVLLIGLAGCQKDPASRIASVQAELDKGAGAQVDRYAPSEYMTAQETLRRARDENNKKNYEAAAQLALEAENQAKLARQVADKNKKDMQDYIKKAIGEARKIIDQTKEEYKNAEKLNVSERELAAVNTALASAEADLKQANDILESGDIVTARDKVRMVQSKLMNAQQSVRNLVAIQAAPYKRD